MKNGEEERVSQLIEKVFAEHIDPLYSIEGRLAFRKYIQPSAILNRHTPDHFRLVAESSDTEQELIGVIEIKEYRHISLFFVDTKYQRKGVGKRLLESASVECKKERAEEITVNSSPNAVAAYQKLGFVPAGIETTTNGIRFIPMKKNLSD
jgi:GNAT superfamily N-acetyltransferase